jgi:lipopolysaccharide/colanic/teichoic acid biosynthesis glycosyltransferase
VEKGGNFFTRAFQKLKNSAFQTLSDSTMVTSTLTEKEERERAAKRKGMIIGFSVSGAIVGVILLLILIIWIKKRKNRKN